MRTSLKITTIAFLMSCVFLPAQAQVYAWKSVNLQGMGYVTGLITHPTTKDIYARTDTYGIYRWDAANTKWLPLMDGKVSTGSVESFAIDPSDANNVYAVNGNKEAGVLYKSTDKGATWTELPNFKSKGLWVEGNGIFRGAGERLAVDPNNGGTTLYFGTRSNGLYKSTDSGATWIQVSTSSIPVGSSAGVVFVIFDPSSGNASTNSQKIYVGVQGQGIYATTNGGTSWSLLSGGPATTAFPIRAAITNSGRAYFTYASADNGGATGYVYKYSGTGSLANCTPSNKANEGFWGIAVSNNAATVATDTIAALQWNPANTSSIHSSINGGTTWVSKKFTIENGNVTQPAWYSKAAGWTYSSALIMVPYKAKEAWLGTGFAAYYASYIIGTTPTFTARMANFEELVVNLVKCPPFVGGAQLIAGFADSQGFRVVDKDVVPSATLQPDVFGIITGIDYAVSDPNRIVYVGGDQTGDASTNYESANPIYRYSDDNGATWTTFSIPTATSVNGNIAISSTDKDRWVLAPKDRSSNLNEPYYTTNAGADWTVTTGTPAGIANGCTEQWSTSEFLVSDKVNGMTFYYYAETKSGGGSGFYRSTDGGASFSLLSSVLPSSYKSMIAAVPGKEGHLFFCSKTGSALYHSTDGGANWTALTGVASCYSIGFGKAMDGSSDPTIYINANVSGIESIYRSTDYGSTWRNINVNVLPLNVSAVTGDMRTEGLVYVATSGRGIFYGTQIYGVGVKPPVANKDGVTVTTNADASVLTVRFKQSIIQPINMSIVNTIGQQLLRTTRTMSQGDDRIQLQLDQNLKKGVYIFSLEIDNKQSQVKFIVQ